MPRPEPDQAKGAAQPDETERQSTRESGGATPPSPDAQTDWQAKAAANYDLFLRARADYDNLARRTQRDVALLVRLGKRDLLLKLLDLADNLERATGSWRTTLAGCQGVDADGLVGGIEMIGRQLQSVLSSEGVQPVASVGQPFDPAVHECIATWDNPAVDCPTVTDEIRRGYTLDGEVLRATQVRVAKP
jgi:molecular chaperone GrpE